MSTTSSSKTFRSRSASKIAVACANASAIAAFASPISFPKLALSSGDKEPNPREARAMGDLSPACAKRAAFRESKSEAEAKALRASSTQVEISSTRIRRTLSCGALLARHI